MRKLITSALPYVNNVPHLGNIIGCVLSADVYARFCRSRGYETRYICGTDEYGTATENKAREEGLTPREICDKYHAIHAEIYKRFNISFDTFGRTSTEEQTEIAQSIFKDLDDAGLIKEEVTERTYCEKDAKFLADRFVEGVCPHCKYEDARGDQCDNCSRLLEPEALINPRCKLCGTPPTLKQTAHLYLQLDALQPKLEAWSKASGEHGAWTRNAVQTTNSWLEKGLLPRPITRDLKWGIPVPKPGYEDKVFYVWFDAPIGYISITAKAYEDWREWWQNPKDVQLYQFMAKDNIPFHTVIFPASLMGTGRDWTTLHHISSTEYLNYEDTKFSKSRNIGVFGTDVADTGIPVDLWRFYLVLIRPEKTDAVFNWVEFFGRVNSDFVNNIGNLVHRTLVYLNKNFEGEIKDFPLPQTHQDFIADCRKQMDQLSQMLEEVKLRDALRLVLSIGDIGNRFFQSMKPWDAIKTDPNHAHTTVSVLAYLVRDLAVMLEPYMPETAAKITGYLNLEKQAWSILGSFEGLDGHRIGSPEILFSKLDVKLAEKYRKKFSGDAPDFGKFKIQVGQVTEVGLHEDNDTLYILKVNVGEDKPRTIVAGMRKRYTPEELQDRLVCVLANLKPAELSGVISEGMILAADKKKKPLELLHPAGHAVGTVATTEDQRVDHGELDISTFKSAPFRIKDNRLIFDDLDILFDGQPLHTEAIANGKVR